MNVLSTIIYFAWFLSEILLHRILRGKDADDKKKQDQGSLAFIWIVIIVFINISVLVSAKTSYLILPGPDMNRIGLSVILLGMVLRFVAIAQLGRLFTVNVTIRKDHHIKKDGLYSILRHPSYAGSLLSFLGFGLSQNNWLGLAIVFIPVFVAFVYRMKIEEKVLSEKFGEEYTDYMKHTSRIIPWIY
ncbi:Protein-S-isoprenylcysteine O-methyltransferase Ste14 [Chitinophaga ginsengisegetis]|uniref:Protein-S-isoprenylcysteine O-methyltransferase Ste14 n=1 Tax=Chitinophaga ginsengisegetis TaxID=393003 RepID=A0A1T5N404_9BACT|nr:isoprenylcysteine carboxylmethyltransferase family protein [Chitinophaga ginsengisegetis]MDR6567572.1 protein-S-isoprenylcysteine O-methyltransferase Ste14 [Chitinophaga ginsengisegetis]MDR6647873.1 protein-S-isoprenylcysteine O-methyltransferase Ste14 [Chitinophaga ginsengisegetis]MDR6654223.1 protein-S-isoprenylcysteine O-methyltransferase Ste14 [Chitinophaga ginsengisegetis]SKC94768.1 Protein-S-isoprenylcysteine O-methyltransferase Ste14 [Chitinophaga ginsengisegetis]